MRRVMNVLLAMMSLVILSCNFQSKEDNLENELAKIEAIMGLEANKKQTSLARLEVINKELRNCEATVVTIPNYEESEYQLMVFSRRIFKNNKEFAIVSIDDTVYSLEENGDNRFVANFGMLKKGTHQVKGIVINENYKDTLYFEHDLIVN